MAKFYAKAPDGTDATLSITVEGFTQSLQQNGWCKMPNGLILQWGLETSGFRTKTVTFQIAYTSFCNVVAGLSSNVASYAMAVYNTTLTSFSLNVFDANRVVSWMAIGN